MNTGNVYFVIGLVVAIVVLANAVTILVVRGSRGVKLDWFHKTGAGLRQPFKHEDQALDELSRLVKQLPSSKGDEQTDAPANNPLKHSS
jgi:hypothetical protein